MGSWSSWSSWVSYTLLGVPCFIPRVRPYLRSVLSFPRTQEPKNPRPPFSSRARRSPLGDHLIPRLGMIMCCMGWLSTTTREGATSPIRQTQQHIMWDRHDLDIPSFSNGARRPPLGEEAITPFSIPLYREMSRLSGCHVIGLGGYSPSW